jgi:outer membrane protein TolC
MCNSSWCGLALALLASQAQAQAELTPIDLTQALSLARTNNAELLTAHSEVEVAEASVPLAHDWQMPKLRVMFNDVQNVPIGQFRWFAGLQWRPPNPWEWANGTDVALAKLLQARFEEASLLWKVTRDIRLAWLDVSGAAAHEAVARNTLEVRTQLLGLLRKRVAQGQGTQIDLNLAQLAETDARQEQLRWQMTGLKNAQSVAYLVGQPVTPVPVALPVDAPVLPMGELLLTRLEHHPVLEALRAKVSASEANVKNVQAKRLPWPEVQFRVRQNIEAPLPALHDFQVGVTVPLAVTPAPQVDVARAVVTRNRRQLEAEQAKLQSEVRVLLARASGLLARWQSFERDYRTTIESHRQLQKRVLSEGSLDPTLLLTADRQAIELEHKRLEVQLDLAKALIELDWAAGPEVETK